MILHGWMWDFYCNYHMNRTSHNFRPIMIWASVLQIRGSKTVHVSHKSATVWHTISSVALCHISAPFWSQKGTQQLHPKPISYKTFATLGHVGCLMGHLGGPHVAHRTLKMSTWTVRTSFWSIWDLFGSHFGRFGFEFGHIWVIWGSF